MVKILYARLILLLKFAATHSHIYMLFLSLFINLQGSEDQADKPLYPGAPVSKEESLLMLMSYVLRNNLTGKALTHLLELFNLMFPGLIPPSHYLFHKEFGSSSQSEVHFYCEKCLAYLGISADCPSHCTLCNTVFDANTS